MSYFEQKGNPILSTSENDMKTLGKQAYATNTVSFNNLTEAVLRTFSVLYPRHMGLFDSAEVCAERLHFT